MEIAPGPTKKRDASSTPPRPLRDPHGAPAKIEHVDYTHYHDEKKDPHEQEQGENSVEIIQGGQERRPAEA